MDVLLFLFALGLGIVAAVPIGPCQIETVKRAISGHLRASELVVLGSASSDALYGVIALYGIAPLLDDPGVLAGFDAVAVLICATLAWLTWRYANEPNRLYREPRWLQSGRWSYVTGFLLGMSNPPIIASWLFGVALAKRVGVVRTPFTAPAKAFFIIGAVAGAAAYLTALSLVTHRLRHAFPPKTISTIYRWLAVALLAVAFYFARDVLMYYLRGR